MDPVSAVSLHAARLSNWTDYTRSLLMAAVQLWASPVHHICFQLKLSSKILQNTLIPRTTMVPSTLTMSLKMAIPASVELQDSPAFLYTTPPRAGRPKPSYGSPNGHSKDGALHKLF